MIEHKRETKREERYYLDSGWPKITTKSPRHDHGLVTRGWQYGRDLIPLCYPQAAHDEKAWGVRLHLPVQLFNGVVASVKL